MFFVGYTNAQEPGRIYELLANKELARAKEAVDSAILLYPTAGLFLVKAVVYDSIANNAEAKNLAADAKWEAFQALQKAVGADAAFVNTQLSLNSYKLAFDLYDGLTREGLAYYNAGAERDDKNSFAAALASFKKAAAVSQFMYTNNWGKPATDTLNLLFISKSSINAEKEEDALLYSKKIADNNFVFGGFKTGYEIVYQWLVYYFKNRKEAVLFYKYLAAGKQQFPQSVYFNLVELDWLREQQQYAALFKKYRELMLADPANTGNITAYYKDQFSYLWKPATAGQPNNLININGFIKGLKQLIAANGTKQLGMEARLLLAKTYINQAQDIVKEQMMRSTTDPRIHAGYKKRRNDLLLLSNKYLKQITAVKTIQNPTIGREAADLLQVNAMALKQ